MKTSLTPLAFGALLLSAGLAPANGTDTYDSLRPTGRLDISKVLVRTGEKPNLDWEINYPLRLNQIIDIQPDDSLTVKERTLMEVRVAGAAFQVGSDHTDLLLQAKVGSGSWLTLFNDPDYRVDGSEVVLSKVVEPGDTVDFSARASKGRNRGWYSSRNTLNTDNTLIALKNGDTIPNFTPAYDQADLNSFLSSYIVKSNNGHGNNLDGVDVSNPGNTDFYDASGPVDDEAAGYQAILGPQEVIYLFELYSTDITSSYYDMQDIVVVVSFKDIKK